MSEEWTAVQREAIETEFERRLAPIIEVQKDWERNYYSSFAKRLGRAIRKAQGK